MIKPNELRIGNLVLSLEKDEDEQALELMEIISIDCNGEGHYNSELDFGKRDIDHAGWFSKDCELLGIPITEEWLVRLGFGRVDGNEFCIITGITIFRIEEKFELGNHDFPIELKYVHQLQNLYFALTGNELELKNK